MKNISFIVLIALFSTVFSSCTKDEPITSITGYNIAFVHEDGSAIDQNECINPNANYALLIKTISTGVFRTTTVKYTLNGMPYTMTFIRNEEQMYPVKLKDGNNEAEIVGTTYKANLFFNAHTNFELVP